MPKISVIVPIYNAESYLKRCVDSILAQTFEDYELILVNDGSSDKSGQICEDYLKLDKRVRVIHQLNQGVSAARQVGLEASKSEFVIFADPDDWVDPTMLTEMLTKAEQDNSDVVFCDYWQNIKDKENYCVQSPREINSLIILQQLLSGQLHGSTWNKLYRLQTIKDNSIRFPIGIYYCEDLWFNCSFMYECKPCVSYLDRAYYHYDLYSNSNSLSRRINRKALESYGKFIHFAISNLLSPDDEELIIGLKYNYKRHAFLSDCNYLNYIKIYPELNKCFIQILKSSDQSRIYKYSELLALKGYLKTGRLFLRCYEKRIVPCLSKLKRISQLL